MMNMFTGDLDNSILALEFYITDSEESLIMSHHGGTDTEWESIEKYNNSYC